MCHAEIQSDPSIKIIPLKRGSMAKLLCIWLRFSSHTARLSSQDALGLPLRAVEENVQALRENRALGCCKLLLSSAYSPEASGRACIRVKQASAQRKHLLADVINHCLTVTLMHGKYTTCGFRW